VPEEAVLSTLLAVLGIIAAVAGLSPAVQTNVREIIQATVPSLMVGGTVVRIGRMKWLAAHLFADTDHDPSTPPVPTRLLPLLLGILSACVVGLSIALALTLTR
jgi:hypothetical protein